MLVAAQCSYIMPPIILYGGWVFMKKLRYMFSLLLMGIPSPRFRQVLQKQKLFFSEEGSLRTVEEFHFWCYTLSQLPPQLEYPNDAHDQGESSSPCVSANTLIKAAAFYCFYDRWMPLKIDIFYDFLKQERIAWIKLLCVYTNYFVTTQFIMP